MYERVSTFQLCIIVRVALCLGRRFESLCARSRNSVRSHFLLCYFLRRKAKSRGDAENRTVKDRHRFAAYLLVLRKSRVLKISLGKGTLRSVYVRNAREQGKQRAAWVYLEAQSSELLHGLRVQNKLRVLHFVQLYVHICTSPLLIFRALFSAPVMKR